MGYVVGVTDAHVTIETIRLESGTYRRTLCIPEGVDAVQLVDVTTGFLRGHPEVRHNGASGLVIGALIDAFPCRPS